jgi:hypothetical protein
MESTLSMDTVIMEDTIKYNGYYITKLFPSGYYQIYLNDRFWKFDDLQNAKDAIDEEIKTNI